jgi:hypothetical protein
MFTSVAHADDSLERGATIRHSDRDLLRDCVTTDVSIGDCLNVRPEAVVLVVWAGSSSSSGSSSS